MDKNDEDLKLKQPFYRRSDFVRSKFSYQNISANLGIPKKKTHLVLLLTRESNQIFESELCSVKVSLFIYSNIYYKTSTHVVFMFQSLLYCKSIFLVVKANELSSLSQRCIALHPLRNVVCLDEFCHAVSIQNMHTCGICTFYVVYQQYNARTNTANTEMENFFILDNTN